MIDDDHSKSIDVPVLCHILTPSLGRPPEYSVENNCTKFWHSKQGNGDDNCLWSVLRSSTDIDVSITPCLSSMLLSPALHNNCQASVLFNIFLFMYLVNWLSHEHSSLFRPQSMSLQVEIKLITITPVFIFLGRGGTFDKVTANPLMFPP